MPDDYYSGILTAATSDGDTLHLRLDLDRCAGGRPPVLALALAGCRDASSALAALEAHLGSLVQLASIAEAGRCCFELSFDYSDEPDLRIEFTAAEPAFEPYALADLEHRLARLERAHAAELAQYEQRARRAETILAAFRRSVTRGLDNAERKAAFFASQSDHIHHDRHEVEAATLHKVLALLEKD